MQMTVAGSDIRPLLVFLVDEDQAVGCSLAGILHSTGCQVKTFLSGSDLIAYSSDAPPDVVITEYIVGPTDGLTVAAWAQNAYPNARIIMTTGSEQVVRHFAGRRLPFPVMEKPLSSKALIAAVHGADLKAPAVPDILTA
jgi:FixJ family two-component response regulator